MVDDVADFGVVLDFAVADYGVVGIVLGGVGVVLDLAVLELVVYDHVVVGVVLNLVQTLAEEVVLYLYYSYSLFRCNKLPSHQSVYFLIVCNQFVFV